jgi:ATP-dependent Clp protease ATP-binding subunit ClpB
LLLIFRTHFRPEFVNRVDDFITFEPLRPSQIKQIVVLRAQVRVPTSSIMSV